jgi:hypothetical protein
MRARTIIPWLLNTTGYGAIMKALFMHNSARPSIMEEIHDMNNISQVNRASHQQTQYQRLIMKTTMLTNPPWNYWHGAQPYIPHLQLEDFERMVYECMN